MTLRVPDQGWTEVRLCSDVHLEDRRLARDDGAWVLELPPLAIDRLEYELEVVREDGTVEVVADPANPARATGAFGEKSVLQAAAYAPPWWLAADKAPGEWDDVALGPVMRRSFTARVWSPVGAGRHEALPLLFAHDGPEYDALAQLSEWAGAVVAAGSVPPFRLVLLPPGDRDQWYSASEGYARALAERIVPRLAARLPPRGPLVGMGASLGGLAWLHAHRRFPGIAGALFLQSGSYFMDDFDAHESGVARYARIVPFVNGVRRSRRRHEHPIPVVLTCGVEEENVHNNRAMAAALAEQGYEVELVESRDMHNYTGWRDTFDPPLTRLLARLWR
jgi:enterochelin esterase-like enzyme